jgi:hypothetical protein
MQNKILESPFFLNKKTDTFNLVLNAILKRRAFSFNFQEGVEDLKNHITYESKTNPNYVEKFHSDFVELLKNYDNDSLKLFFSSINDYLSDDCQDGGLIEDQKTDSFLSIDDKDGVRIWFEQIYYELFENNKSLYNSDIINNYLELKQKIDSQILLLKDFDFINESTTLNENIFSNFNWAFVTTKFKVSTHEIETKFELQHDPKYKYIIFAQDRAYPDNMRDGVYPKRILIQKVLAVKNSGEVETIKDFTKSNSFKEEYEKAKIAILSST